MKKINIFLLGALGLLAGACAEDVEPSKPQHNPQEPILNAADDVISAKAGVLASTDVIALEAYNQPEAKIPVMKLEETKNLPEGAEVVYKLELAASTAFVDSQTLVASPSASDPDLYEVDAAEWQAAQIAIFGQTVKVQTCYYRVPVYLSLSGSEYRLGSTDYYAEEGVFQITRMKPGYEIEDEYYVFGNYVGNDSPATAVKMLHSDQDAYDDPEFSFIFDVTAAQAVNGYTLMVAPATLHNASANASACFGTDTPNEPSGNLIIGGQPIIIYNEGPFRLTVNMKDLTYSIGSTPENLYTFYGTVKAADILPLYTTDKIQYTGVNVINNQWTLAGQPDKNGPVIFKQDPNAQISISEDGMTQKSKLTQDADGATLTTPVKGKKLYWSDINLVQMTYAITAIEKINVIGDFNNWKEGGAEFTANKNLDKWTATNVVLDGGGFKFRANDAWDVNFGSNVAPIGNVFALAANGDNMTIEAGTYDITIDFSVYPYTATFTKK